MAPEQRLGDLDRAIGVGHVDHEGGRDAEPVEDLGEARVPDRHVEIPRMDAQGHGPGAGGACGRECFSKPAEQRWALLGRRVDLRGLEIEMQAVEGHRLQGLDQAPQLRAALRPDPVGLAEQQLDLEAVLAGVAHGARERRRVRAHAGHLSGIERYQESLDAGSVDGAELALPELGGAVAEPLGRVPQVQRPSTRSRRTRLRRGGAGRRLAGSRLEAGRIGVPVDQRLVGLHQRLGGVVALQTRPLELLGHVAFELHGPEVALLNRGVRRGEPRRGKLRIPPQHRRAGDERAPLLLQLLSADLVLEAGAGELRGRCAGQQPAL